jgi:hypothetical protein
MQRLSDAFHATDGNDLDQELKGSAFGSLVSLFLLEGGVADGYLEGGDLSCMGASKKTLLKLPHL